MPLYVIGRQAVFGSPFARLVYVDPVTKDDYWPRSAEAPRPPAWRRSSSTASTTAGTSSPPASPPTSSPASPRTPAGSTSSSRPRSRCGSASARRRTRWPPSRNTSPTTRPAALYDERRAGSELRRTIYEIVQASANRDNSKGINWHYRLDFSIDPNQALVEIAEEFPKAQVRLNVLLEVEKKLRSIQKHRDREPDKRWQAAYDLMLAQTVAYQVSAYEYIACSRRWSSSSRRASSSRRRCPRPTRHVFWHLDHSRDKKAPASETEKKYAEAIRLIELVKSRHPHTPWADLAQDELNRGFGCNRYEWHHDPRYNERAKLVPKY